MFEKSYEFKFIQASSPKVGDVFLRNHIFTFFGKDKKKYVVNVEEYPYHTYILKFYLKAHRGLEDKYNRSTNVRDVSRILRTCINIMLYFLDKDHLASFGFSGAPIYGEEGIANNKKFRVYTVLMNRFFSRQKYMHIIFEKENVYLMFNRANKEQQVKDDMLSFFSEHYEFL